MHGQMGGFPPKKFNRYVLPKNLKQVQTASQHHLKCREKNDARYLASLHVIPRAFGTRLLVDVSNARSDFFAKRMNKVENKKVDDSAHLAHHRASRKRSETYIKSLTCRQMLINVFGEKTHTRRKKKNRGLCSKYTKQKRERERERESLRRTHAHTHTHTHVKCG